MRSPIISIGHFIPANYIGNPLPEGVGGEKKKKNYNGMSIHGVSRGETSSSI